MKLSRFATLSSSVLLAVGLALTGAGAAQGAQQAASTSYVALGDSYSAGVGSGSYDSASGDCKRSTLAYPKLWAAAHAPSSFAFVACSGARTGDVLSSQLSALTSSTSLVSLTIGGNDAGFASTMTDCVLHSESTCLASLATANSYIDSTLPGLLDKVYSAISAKSPSAHVVVLGYPRFYQLNGSCIVGLSETERAAINAASDHLNSVTAKRAADHGFAFGDIASAFTGHEICSSNSWLHSVNLLDLTESYHPTAAGQSGGYLPVLNAQD
ncbi:SGNH/GDSL hydrolase family protein [Streptomyces sp. NBC_01387]|uniref:SGNH/GDSL hydrolase family protein n=1 Tax=unclassified Streptomyces TaxID=2593676 RepID=UPI002024C815|nr:MULTISPECIES: SGNH/GDSL hydrolase family protein [unclassified Streptomyces]MCX4551994.1 SGNH/GDSL hydrolase family protein [Streptomyces sp. NBC_01500]WSC23346.1 SGNH/GDSL hydrolase family protein [Streptomyces sp. NBC_01766]WSV57257.1 SGNH/GDSL hydrolase family protein [Streptomyces sp. NBC_01014]